MNSKKIFLYDENIGYAKVSKIPDAPHIFVVEDRKDEINILVNKESSKKIKPLKDIPWFIMFELKHRLFFNKKKDVDMVSDSFNNQDIMTFVIHMSGKSYVLISLKASDEALKILEKNGYKTENKSFPK